MGPARLPALVLLLVAPLWSGCERSDGGAKRKETTPEIGGAGMNVVLVSVDTQRADCLGCYGHPEVKTPNIDRFAAEGTRFAWCISSAPLTLPSHSTMLTGSYPFVHGARDNGKYRVGAKNVTLAEVFKETGYATGAEVAAEVLTDVFGLNQGFDHYGQPASDDGDAARAAAAEGQLLLEAQTQPAVEPEKPRLYLSRTAEEVTRAATELLTGLAKANQPFFAFFHYFDPHWPHIAPERFASQYREGYYAEIAYFDEQFGKLIEAIGRLGLANKTLVILTSDHGEGRGQHGEYTHANFLYDTTLHVPLIFWCPGQVPAGQVVESQVRLVDLASTIVAFTRLEKTPQMQGVSLLPLLADPGGDLKLPCYSDTVVARHTFGFSQLRSLRAEGWKYILGPRPELYHVEADRLELIDLSEAEPERAATMRQQLWDLIAASPPPPASRALRQVVDEQTLRKLEALGYVGLGAAGDDQVTDVGSELDDFEPVGENPKDHVEELAALSMGLGSFHAGDYKAAERVFRHLIDANPDHPIGPSRLAETLVALERNDEAIELFLRAIELDPDRYADYRALGILLAARGDLAEAERYFREALERQPDDLNTHLELAKLLVGQERYEDALLEYEAAAAIAPGAAFIHFEKGITYKLLRQYEQAVAAFTKVLSLNPSAMPAYLHLAETLQQSGHVDEAIEHLLAAIRAHPDAAPLYFGLAKCHQAKGDLDRAGVDLRRVVELMPDSAFARENLGVHLAGIGKQAEAIDQFRQALELEPDRPATLQSLAETLDKAGRIEEAGRTYKRLVELAPQSAAAYLGYSRLLARQGDTARAVKLLRQGRQAVPDNAEIANDLAWRLATANSAELRDGPEAVKLAELANELTDGQNIQMLDTLAAAQAEAGRFEDAVATADKAIHIAEQADARGIAARIAVRRALYQNRKAHREPVNSPDAG